MGGNCAGAGDAAHHRGPFFCIQLGLTMPRLVLCLPVLVSLALTACASGPPTSVHVVLRGGARLNPDETGLPNPVQTHIFMLRAVETINNTDYFQLADHERAVLGPDLLAQADQILRPGKTSEIVLPVPPGTKFVAITAAFRNIDQGTWKLATPLKGHITVDLGAQSLTLAQAK
jgi:type VI secretion system protein VasD